MTGAAPVPSPSAHPVFALVGPTAAGKTEIAIAAAEAVGGEIVAVDSMTIYRGMDVGTAKPTAQQRERVPHHMIDVADPADPYSVARFQRAARAAIAGIHARRRVPLLTGGSGLYFRAVVDDLEFPPADAAVRARLMEEPPDALRAKLRDADPESHDRIEPENLRRIVRALEVIQITGSRFSDFRDAWETYRSRYDLTVVGVSVPGTMLAERIAARVAAMIDAGLVDEVRDLLDRGLRGALTASRAIAYREIVAHLDGEIGLDEAVSLTERATRRYARRQMTWFRRDPRVRWVDASDPVAAAEAVTGLFSEAASRLAPLH